MSGERINPQTTWRKCMNCPGIGGCDLHQALIKAETITNRKKLDRLLRDSPGVIVDNIDTTASTVVFPAPHEVLNDASASVIYSLVCGREPHAISGSVRYAIGADEAKEIIESNRSQINSHAKFRRKSR